MMNSKSKFVTFILSFIPGLSHLYLGFTRRALIFFALCFGAIFGTACLVGVAGESLFVILAFALPLIWFFALIDAFTLIDKMRGSANSGQGAPYEEMEAFGDNKKMVTATLSLVPGAGHMYLGYLKDGALLMAVFFFTAFLMGWLNLSLFLFILPVVWFYSLFDALQRVESAAGEKRQKPALWNWLESHPHLVGWSLIILGCLVILERHITPLLTPEIHGYLQTAVVAVILIAGGIKLLAGSKVESRVSSAMSDNDTHVNSYKEGRDEQCDSGE
jgi:TM2 domain-containing membrane protein YozV